MIEVNKLTKAFGGKTVLNNVSFSVADRGVYAVVGKSGIGKTTLLRLIAGLDTPDSGTIVTNNLKIAYKFQEPRLMKWLTALENVSVVIEDKADAEKIALAWLKKVDLAEASSLFPDQLSGGMQQRVALARALAFDGDLLLLDEPFSAVDEETKHALLSLVKQYAEDHIVILVTHDPSEIEALNASVIPLWNE